ncbi:hypothetical protein ACQPYK_36245 [Streptosporangium sp. CA-135522]|uniref:hypothetical protein n=1 Tax=Streptosporangium sp. CA-135522 TaxID=3240072 RepID=UPI003D94EA89
MAEDDLEAIIAALREDVTDTDDDTETATASATEAMWRYWQECIEKNDLPTGARLAEVGGCNDSYGRKMRKAWYGQLDSRTRRRLDAAKKVTA